jgi:hypothetical protein
LPPDRLDWRDWDDITAGVIHRLQGVLYLTDPADIRRERAIRDALRTKIEGPPGHVPDSAFGVVVVGVLIFAKAYIENLAKRAENRTPDLIRRMLFRRKRGTVVLGVDDDSVAALVVTTDLPDDAILAIRDLDVTAPELRGKLLRWDPATGVWRPSDASPDELDEATHTD